MELAHSKKETKKAPNSGIWFKKYTRVREIFSERPYCFFYSGNAINLDKLANYSLLEKTHGFTLGIRKDLECLGFGFDKLLALVEGENFAVRLIEREIESLLNDEMPAREEASFSREDELEILSAFFRS